MKIWVLYHFLDFLFIFNDKLGKTIVFLLPILMETIELNSMWIFQFYLPCLRISNNFIDLFFIIFTLKFDSFWVFIINTLSFNWKIIFLDFGPDIINSIRTPHFVTLCFPIIMDNQIYSWIHLNFFYFSIFDLILL